MGKRERETETEIEHGIRLLQPTNTPNSDFRRLSVNLNHS